MKYPLAFIPKVLGINVRSSDLNLVFESSHSIGTVTFFKTHLVLKAAGTVQDFYLIPF
ncbi:MAG: hypothetical protein ACJAZ2_001888 [Glaciecola sp.]|jgi:hypothetical protein